MSAGRIDDDDPMDSRCDMAALPDCLPPVRAIDTELARRIASGCATEWEARQVQGLMAWVDRYERALRHIAVHGDAESARVAVLAYTVGEW